MQNDLLLLNTLIITIIIMILDYGFIHNHLTLIQPLSDQFFDSTNLKDIEKELDKEVIKEQKIIEKIKKKDKKNGKNGKNGKKKKEIIEDKEINLENEEVYNEQLYDNYPEEYNDQQENPYYDDESNYRVQNKPDRLRVRTPNQKHYAYSEPMIDSMDSILAYNA
jgi:phosphate starvation-inducible protein PhoH